MILDIEIRAGHGASTATHYDRFRAWFGCQRGVVRCKFRALLPRFLHNMMEAHNMLTRLDSIDELHHRIGAELGPSNWLEVDQERINAFASATDDHQWIHVDAERAAAGPFGKTIAHGFLTLSLVSYFTPQMIEVAGVSLVVNYGTDRVRFVSPVPVDSRVRARGTIANVVDFEGGVQLTIATVIELEGAPKPACVADCLVRFYA